MSLKILISGGAGFVGSSLAYQFRAKYPTAQIVVFDNLKRRGSENNLEEFKKQNILFVHGDVRNIDDFDSLKGPFDLFIEASAEPSVTAGLDGTTSYLIHTNLNGTVNCLNYAKKNSSLFVFLSTSRVYSIEPLRNIRLIETENRFEIDPTQSIPGINANGITTEFPVLQPRSLYGATKLASEMIIQEYATSLGMYAVINRCGVLAGPGQFGKVDQGVFTLWVANHYFGMPLKFTGFGGTGRQVRDLLHPADLFNLIEKQFARGPGNTAAPIYNVGGGRDFSVSMKEMTLLCQEATKKSVLIEPNEATHPNDIPLYITDNSQVRQAFNWEPTLKPSNIVSEITQWIAKNEAKLKFLFAN